jgi:hypothetical protein
VKNLFVETFQAFSAELAQPLATPPPRLATNNSYFDSFESCYAFLAEVSLEELQQDACNLGLDPTGLDKYQIAKLIYQGAQQQSSPGTGRGID